MATERTRHLDVGGLQYGNLTGVVFLGLARTFPKEDFYIADITAKDVSSKTIPPNLHISSPEIGGISFPFLSTYRLAYPPNYFDDARMDMVLDLVNPDEALKMFWEVRRCLKPGGSFTIVDEIENSSIAKGVTRLSGLKQTRLLNTQQILESGYHLSETAKAFKYHGHDLFLLRSQKNAR
jgi:ubiquinone/menaquinone biosynthesis C-methylase UbiE